MECTTAIANALASLDGNDKLINEKMAALIQLGSLINSYQKEYFHETLVQAILDKKTTYICGATSKADLKEILSMPMIHYNGNKIVPVGKYHIPEEELIYWSITSLRAPLISYGFERYMEVFAQVFPGVDLN
ncbi:MAG: hypothetical protein LBI03_05940 [Clostridiales bacterium]|jgi:hypothetical protein|nr:hypothetical protein [Clostridiales bacterium]